MSALLFEPKDVESIAAAYERRPPAEDHAVLYLAILAGGLLLAALVAAFWRPLKVPALGLIKKIGIGIAGFFFALWLSSYLVEYKIVPMAIVKDAFVGAGLGLVAWLSLSVRGGVNKVSKPRVPELVAPEPMQPATEAAALPASSVTPLRAGGSKIKSLLFTLIALQVASLAIICLGWQALSAKIAAVDNGVSESTIQAMKSDLETAAKDAASAHCWAKRSGQNFAEKQADAESEMLALRLGVNNTKPDCD